MGKHVFTVEQKCQSCGGTGLYVGFAEKDGFAVVCHTCKGTGQVTFTHEYEDFEGRVAQEGVAQVVQHNPGIGLGTNETLTHESFGGVPYADWRDGKPFPPQSEMRRYVCPAWWYQGVNYKLKPSWDKCLGCGSFSGCEHFADKAACWDRWDKEHPST